MPCLVVGYSWELCNHRDRPGACGSLVVGSDYNSLHGDLVAVLPLLVVTPEPHFHLPPVHDHPVVVPGDAVPGRDDEPVCYESSTTGSASHAGPGTSECGLNKGKFLSCRSGLVWPGLAPPFQSLTLSLAIQGQEWG